MNKVCLPLFRNTFYNVRGLGRHERKEKVIPCNHLITCAIRFGASRSSAPLVIGPKTRHRCLGHIAFFKVIYTLFFFLLKKKTIPSQTEQNSTSLACRALFICLFIYVETRATACPGGVVRITKSPCSKAAEIQRAEKKRHVPFRCLLPAYL